MATGGYDRNVDSGVTCSICLEPYRGRQPKLLPCSHTFCLPCLTQIAEKERKRLRQTTSEEGEVDVSITCPTCRSPVTLPLTGVAGLLTNVYLDDSGGDQPDPRPFLCDLCEEGQEAKLTCGTCLTYFCTRCRRTHDKLCKSGQVSEVTVKSANMSKVKAEDEEDGSGSGSQIEMMEALLKKMKETEKRSSQQKLTTINRGVKDESSQHGQSNKNLESKVDLLTNLVTSLQSQVTGLQNQNTMLTSLHEKHDREMTSIKTASKKDRDVVTSLEREVAKLRDKNAILCQDKEQLRNDVTNLQSDVTRVRDYVNTLQVELDKLQGQQGAVQSDIAALRAEQGKDTAELNTLKAEQGKDQAELKTFKTELNTLKTEQGKDQAELNTLKAKQGKDQTELKTLKTELNTMKAEQGKDQAELKCLKTELNTLKAEQGKVQGEQNTLKSNAAALKTEQGKLHTDFTKVQSDVQALTAQPKDSKKQVAFQARHSALAITLKKGETLICDVVVSSVGGGYDNRTGVFTVPVSGLYCFIVTSRCAADDLKELCSLLIKLDNKDIAYLCAYGKTKCTAHAAVHATAGQKVVLRSYKNNNKFVGGWSTTFTGFLVQPDF